MTEEKVDAYKKGEEGEEEEWSSVMKHEKSMAWKEKRREKMLKGIFVGRRKRKRREEQEIRERSKDETEDRREIRREERH